MVSSLQHFKKKKKIIYRQLNLTLGNIYFINIDVNNGVSGHSKSTKTKFFQSLVVASDEIIII